MEGKSTLRIDDRKRSEILKYFSEVNMNSICKEIGVNRGYVLRVVEGTARDVRRYHLVAKVIAIAKAQYEQKLEAIQAINSI